MSSYLNDDDFANLHVEFRNSVGGVIGAGAVVSDNDAGPANVWNLNTGTGGIPIGTATVRLSVYGTPIDAGPDGYTDNVSFQVTNVLPELSITVNRDDGTITLSNLTGSRRTHLRVFDHVRLRSARAS